MKRMYDAILCCPDEVRRDKIVGMLSSYHIGLLDKISPGMVVHPGRGGAFQQASRLSKLAMECVGFPGLGEGTEIEVMALAGKKFKLNERPGKIRDMMRMMRGVDDRRAKMTTVMVLTFPSGRQKHVKGELGGWIVERARKYSWGDVFIPDSFSVPMGKLSEGVQEGISSLRKAATKMNGVLRQYAA